MASTEFPRQKIGHKGRWQRVPIEWHSDGEQQHWPSRPEYRPSSDETYLIALGTEWMERRGLKDPAVNYYIEHLPKGYNTFETDFTNAADRMHERLFGHCSGRCYDSVVSFMPHFLWLMKGMVDVCDCDLCCIEVNVEPTVNGNARPRAHLQRLEISAQRLREIPDHPKLAHRLTEAQETDNSDSSVSGSSAHEIATGRSRQRLRATAPIYQDEEGTEDIFKAFVVRLHNQRSSEQSIEQNLMEVNSIDWRAEHELDGHGLENLLPDHLTRIEHQHSFIPRLGELVLWIPNFPDGHYLMQDSKTSHYKFFDFKEKRFCGFPDWRAGVVTAAPSSSVPDGPIDFGDLLDTPNKNSSPNTTGFRIETLPDLNDPLNKPMSRQYKSVPLHHIRPLSHWQPILRGIHESELHPSVKNGFTFATSISLLEKFKASGQWPTASIHCKGVYIGAELITVGDTVRLKSPTSPKVCTDVLVVDSIRLKLEKIQDKHVQPGSPLLASKSSIWLIGRAFSLDERKRWQAPTADRADQDAESIELPSEVPLDDVKTTFRPVGSAGYGKWYAMHDFHNRYEISHDQVLGRLYEADAVRLWTSQFQNKPEDDHTEGDNRASMDFDVNAIMSARQYATATDARMPEPQDDQLQWYWADTRAEALDIETFNGHEVGRYHNDRDPDTVKFWHKVMSIINARSNGNDASSPVAKPHLSQLGGNRHGKKAGSKAVDEEIGHPGQPERGTETTPKRSSRLARAVLASIDEDDQNAIDEDIEDVEGNMRSISQRLRAMSTHNPRRQRKQVSDKEFVKGGAVHPSAEYGRGESIDDMDDDAVPDDSQDEWLGPLPLARGGTEEPSDGDYDPNED